jgi:predicted ABC-class ATPase
MVCSVLGGESGILAQAGVGQRSVADRSVYVLFDDDAVAKNLNIAMVLREAQAKIRNLVRAVDGGVFPGCRRAADIVSGHGVLRTRWM